MKFDFTWFTRVQLRNGSGGERLQSLCEASRNAHARAFAALLRRIREIDSVGVIPDAHDHSEVSNAAYAEPVPKELMENLEQHKDPLEPDLRAKWQAAGFKTEGNRETIFGPGVGIEDYLWRERRPRYRNNRLSLQG